MEAFICVRCGTQYPPSVQPPERCFICADEREAILPGGQRWTTLAELRGPHRNSFAEIEPNVTAICTEPAFAIGQQAYLIRTPHGNVLWDCISLIDAATEKTIRALGGIAAIAISHPHFYSCMIEWSRTFDDAPIFLHTDNRAWVARPDPAIRYWETETHEIMPGSTLIRCGGHFPGSTVLHWVDGVNGRGALFTGDTIGVVADRRWVTFMYSFPNYIPLSAAQVRDVVAAVELFSFDRIYGGWKGEIVAPDAKAAVHRSAARYSKHIS